MGVFGAGLYAGDFAMDLRSAAGAVSRLPFDGDRLLDILCGTQPGIADNPEDAEYTTFWLVIADQFAKRGIVSARLRDKALSILDEGSDLAKLKELGMKAADLRKRGKVLEELRVRIATSKSAQKRTVLKNPQPFVMEPGDLYLYPTCGGTMINPYFPTREGSGRWRQDGWAARVIVENGRAFDFLAWYRPLTVAQQTAEKPELATLQDGELLWKLSRPGTCTVLAMRRMELEKLPPLQVDPVKLRLLFPKMPAGTSAAIEDISIANSMSVGPAVPAAAMPRPGEPVTKRWGQPYPTLLGLGQILA